MYKKIHFYILSFLVVTLVFVMLSPLDYTSSTYGYCHFWLTLIYGVLLLITYADNKKVRKSRIIASTITLPVLALISFYAYVANPNEEIEITPVPNSNLVVTNMFYTLFMMGNPRMEITVGYPILGNALIWNINSYTKFGEGDSESDLAVYHLPAGINKEDFGLFVLEKENYLFVWEDKMVYPIKKK